MSIQRFRDEYRFLSNFWVAPITLPATGPQSFLAHLHGRTAPTSEHFYQAAKTLDPIEAERIVTAETPHEAKDLGQAVEPHPDWERAKIAVMEEVLAAKFDQHPPLRAKLLDTGDEPLIEGNPWHDTFWGACTCDEHNGAGDNNLGRLLMELRARLQDAGDAHTAAYVAPHEGWSSAPF